MATEKLEKLNTEQLKKKYKFTTLFLLICLIIMGGCCLVMFFIKPIQAVAFVPLFIVLVPIAIGRKKIIEELKKRETTV
jgi:uncharacterized membrane protein HdeD (DUF308 family)